jgi:hypothetical protein
VRNYPNLACAIFDCSGILNDGEECDDGNQVDGKHCSGDLYMCVLMMLPFGDIIWDTALWHQVVFPK